MWFISFHLPWFKNEDESTMLQYYFFFFLMKYVGKILYDSEKIIKKKKWYSIFRLLNKPFWKRIWIDIFKIWKIHRIVTFIKNIKREKKKKKRHIKRDWWGIVEACRSQKTCFQDRDEAFRGEFFRLPDATQVKREFSFPRSSRSFLRSAAKKKKEKKKIVSQALSYTRIIHGSQFFTRKKRGEGRRGNIWSLKLIFWQPRGDSYFGRDRGDFASKRTDRAASSSINWVSTRPLLSVEYYIFEEGNLWS